MRLKLSLRPIELSDIGPDCPFFPEDGDYERRFNAIVQDIASIDGVASATAAGENEVHIIARDLGLEDFKSALRPILLRDFQHIRLSQLVEQKEESS